MISLSEVPVMAALYCVEFENDLIKVGISKDARNRLKSIEAVANSRIKRKILFPGWVSLEAPIKFHFREFRAFGTEWFKNIKYEIVANEIFGMIYDDLEIKRRKNLISDDEFEEEVNVIMREICDKELYLEDDLMVDRIKGVRENLKMHNIDASFMIFPRFGYRIKIVADDQDNFKKVIDFLLDEDKGAGTNPTAPQSNITEI